MKVLITCPPMIKQINRYASYLKEKGIDFYCPNVTQTLSEEELMELLPQYDGWIIGDDPATRQVFDAGKQGRLKVAIKWGVGVDNVDFEACKDLNIPITNTPGMFGNEVADVAIGYVLGLARDLFYIDSEVKKGNWVKPTGISLTGKKVCLVGFGDIGRNIAKRLLAFDMDIHVSDPGFEKIDGQIICKYDPQLEIDEIFNQIIIDTLDNCLTNTDFVIVSCALNKHTYHILNKENLILTNKNLRLINISRGPTINEQDVIELLDSRHIYGLAFDVFEQEPLSDNNKLRDYPHNIFGSHNGSNTIEAVDKTSYRAIDLLYDFYKSS